MSDLAFQPLTGLADKIASGELGALELLDHYIGRIEAHNGGLNAVVAMDFDLARKQALKADAVAKDARGPLHGVPMTVKDAFEVAGIVSTGGISELRNHVPHQDAAPVARLRAAGATIMAKTNVPAFSGDWQSYNDIYGATSNPWDSTRTPGGSSGGAAAAVAAGLTGGDIGSDIGGSIRLPAHFCGLFGHKPSHGVVPIRGHMPPAPHAYSEADLAVAGPLGRSAGDLELLFDILAGDPGDVLRPHAPLRSPRITNPEDLRVAVWLDEPDASTDEAAAGAVRDAEQALGSAGARVDWEARPDFRFRDCLTDYLLVLNAIVSSDFPPKVIDRMAHIATDLSDDDQGYRALQARGAVLSYRQLLSIEARRTKIKDAWQSFFQDFDVVLCPPVSVAAFPHDTSANMAARHITVNGAETDYFDLMHWASLATFAHLPATVAPVRRTDGGLPVGVQIIGGYLEDRTTLGVAAMLEDLLGGFTAPPDYG